MSSSEFSSNRRRTIPVTNIPFVSHYDPFGDVSLRVDHYKNKCKYYWDSFYRSNGTRAYRNRHWICQTFPQISNLCQTATEGNPKRLLEVGCGVGNSAFPLLQTCQHLFVIGIDISSVAIQLAQQQAQHVELTDRFLGLTHNIAQKPFPRRILTSLQTSHVDMATLFFVLCSIPVENHGIVARHIVQILVPFGGLLFFRDYAQGDMAETRFIQNGRTIHRQSEMDSHVSPTRELRTYARQNGTLSHFFTLKEVQTLLVQMGGLEQLELFITERETVNRKTKLHLKRRFVNAVFRRSPKKE